MKDIKKILAKSNGITLIEHSNMVKDVAMASALSISDNLSDTVMKAIEYGSLLHDIGKCTSVFQKRLGNSNADDDLDNDKKIKFAHNVIGWAFLSKYLVCDDDKLKSLILYVVHWHHGISDELAANNDIEINDHISDKDKEIMISYVKHIGLYINDEPSLKPSKTPYYYHDDINKEQQNNQNMFVLSCVIYADRIVSSLTTNELLHLDKNNLVLDDLLRNSKVDITKHTFYNTDRFNKQLEIIDSIKDTTIVKAPAGYGKTLIGLLRSLYKRDKKLIWVCPRNIVATSVYKSIIEELNNFKCENVTVELYLSGDVIESNHISSEKFNSDIIVTNIDNYLAPSVNNSQAKKLFNILSADVIFDEYHELIGNTPLFACFVNIMQVRHRLTNSETILLSATPSCMEILWDVEENKTNILPNKETHYKAQHTKLYDIYVINELKITTLNDKNLVIVNTVSNSQKLTQQKYDNKNILIHSYFQNTDREKITKDIYNEYDKNANINKHTNDLIGTHILQASLDISFKHLYESVISPEASLQRIGRCNRWGTYENGCSINFLVYADKGEDKLRDILYRKDLSLKWSEYLTKYNGKKLCLDDLYKIYNDYSIINEKSIKSFLNIRYSDSLEQLSKIYSIKYFNNTNIKTINSKGGNNLRSLNNPNDFYITCKKNDGSDNYCDPFSMLYYNREVFRDECSDNKVTIRKIMKYITRKKDPRFDFDSMVKTKNSKINWKIYGKKTNTPHIKLDFVYDTKLGLINENKILLDYFGLYK